MADSDDRFSKLLSDSQAGFEQQVKSLMGGEPTPSTPEDKKSEINLSIPVPQSLLPGAPLKSPEGRDKRVWSSHPKSGLR